MGWSCLPDSAAAAASGSFVKSATADVGFLMKSSCLNGTKQMFFMLSSVPIFFAEADSASLVETVISTGLALRRCDLTAIVTGVAVIVKRKQFSTVF